MAKRKGTIPEVELVRTRAGFHPAWSEDGEVERWQIWMQSDDGELRRRARYEDLHAAGFKVKKRKF